MVHPRMYLSPFVRGVFVVYKDRRMNRFPGVDFGRTRDLYGPTKSLKIRTTNDVGRLLGLIGKLLIHDKTPRAEDLIEKDEKVTPLPVAGRMINRWRD